MKTRPFFLDTNNHAAAGGKTIAQRVSRQKREHLWDERDPRLIDTVVIHYASALEADPKRPFDVRLIAMIFCDLGVSSHYVIDRKGSVFVFVPEDEKAWHCGGSIMPPPDNRRGVNTFSIGIELVASAGSGFTKKQYAALGRLCRDVEKRRGRKMIYIGHDAIAGERAVRLGLRKDIKIDPGEKFDWSGFARERRPRPF
jgi:N-acetyl-anhydromuramyl-L-alanine amidase AmpD